MVTQLDNPTAVNGSSLPASPNGSVPAPSNYGAIFGYSADDSQRNLEYYDTETYGAVAGPVTKKQFQKTGTYDQVFTKYRTMQATDNNSFKALQQKLYEAGFYDSYLSKGETVHLGSFDGNTQKALNDAMSEAVIEGHPVEDVLDQRTDPNAPGNGSGTSVHVTNPDSLKAAIQAVAPDLLGQRAPDDVVNQIVGKYQELENSQNSQMQSGASTITDAPSGSGWFEEQLRQLMPQTVSAEQTGQKLNAFQSIIGGGGGSAYHG